MTVCRHALVAYGFEAARQKRFIEGSGLPIRLSTIELIEIGAFVTINGKTIDNRRPQLVRGGDRIVLGTPGAGGFGSANLRSTADRERDRKMGYVEL